MSRALGHGGSWEDPIWFRQKWRIYMNDESFGPWDKWMYIHDDYDGAEDAHDGRYGYAPSLADCRREIDDLYSEHGDYEVSLLLAKAVRWTEVLRFWQFLFFLLGALLTAYTIGAIK